MRGVDRAAPGFRKGSIRATRNAGYLLHVVAVGQAQVLLRRHVAEHGAAEPADHGGADARGDVVVAGRSQAEWTPVGQPGLRAHCCKSLGDVGGERAERIERRLAALLELLVHVDLDLVQRQSLGANPGRGLRSITWQPRSHATLVSSPSVSNSANWARSLASAIEPGRSPSPSEKLTSYVRINSQISSKCS